jgi:hypothetical protein
VWIRERDQEEEEKKKQRAPQTNIYTLSLLQTDVSFYFNSSHCCILVTAIVALCPLVSVGEEGGQAEDGGG